MNNLLATPTLGYGCYALSGAYGKAPDAQTSVRLLEYAYELGIRFFDTAQGYDETEALLGKALGKRRKEAFIASKVSPAPGGRPSLTRERVIAACESSLANLGTDYIDLYQVHFNDPFTPVSETVAALEELKQGGKILNYGLGHLPLARTEEYLCAGSATTVLVEMNALSTHRYDELQALRQKHRFSIIAFSPTARGLLTGKVRAETVFSADDMRSLDPQFRMSRLALGLGVASELERIGAELARTASQVAIAWVLGRPGVSIALIGPKNPQHLRENCAALTLRLDMSTQHRLNAIVAEHAAKLRAALDEEVASIVHTPLPPCKDEAGKALIYALEYVTEQGVLPEKDATVMFRHLLSSLRGKPSIPLADIQKTLASYTKS